MNIIYAEYNMYRNSIDIYTHTGYMLRIDCDKAEDCYCGAFKQNKNRTHIKITCNNSFDERRKAIYLCDRGTNRKTV